MTNQSRSRVLKWSIRVVALIVIVYGTMAIRISMSESVAGGVENMQLAPCPESPNCVSTQTDQPDKKMEPLEYNGSAEESRLLLKSVLKEHPRTRIVEEKENYLHAECRSLVFRFVDDVEFLFDDEAEKIHFRSASRIGHSDLGVNRKRMELISRKYRDKADHDS